MTEQLSVYAEKSIGDAVAKAYTYATEDSGKRAVIACGSLSYLSEVIRCMGRMRTESAEKGKNMIDHEKIEQAVRLRSWEGNGRRV